jgi:hypothetical protein
MNAPRVLCTVIGRFLVGLASREDTIVSMLMLISLLRELMSPGVFSARELLAYNILARYTSRCSIDTGRRSPQAVVKEILSCIETRPAEHR